MAATVLFGAASVSAQNEYIVGADDVLNVSVWQRDDLSRTVAVRATGRITFPPVGEIQAAGLSTSQLAQRIEDELYAYTRQRPEVTVAVVAFNSRKVFITGQVAQPGRYVFEQIPSLPEVLGIAGGAMPGAQLSDVRIVRTSGGVAQSIRVDLQGYLHGSQAGSLPELLPGDLIYVPGSFGNAQAAAMAGEGMVAYVFGQVARPGAYPVSGEADIVEVLAMAGGTTPVANLRKVQVLTHDAGAAVVADVDVEAYLQRGAAAGGFPVRAGDTINVPSRQPGTVGKAWAYTGQFLGLSRDLLNAVLIGDYLKNR
jgi:polysaccharide export outer membrane protein